LHTLWHIYKTHHTLASLQYNVYNYRYCSPVLVTTPGPKGPEKKTKKKLLTGILKIPKLAYRQNDNTDWQVTEALTNSYL